MAQDEITRARLAAMSTASTAGVGGLISSLLGHPKDEIRRLAQAVERLSRGGGNGSARVIELNQVGIGEGSSGSGAPSSDSGVLEGPFSVKGGYHLNNGDAVVLVSGLLQPLVVGATWLGDWIVGVAVKSGSQWFLRVDGKADMVCDTAVSNADRGKLVFGCASPGKVRIGGPKGADDDVYCIGGIVGVKPPTGVTVRLAVWYARTKGAIHEA